MCDDCNDTGLISVSQGPGAILTKCLCRYPKIETPANKRKTICPDCEGEGREEIPSNGPGRVTQRCRLCGGVGKI